ncbi:hypothetical protein AB1Y20_019662 [Prymnesium parvum]|uniref:EamA domain-containing protein n=1 Tax=Prymnesium parvum TaxID=97485 RepID=A0AB34JT15_PRYPA
MANFSGNLTNSTLEGDGRIEPSTPLCILFSALGGLLEVTSTMCLAYPEFRRKQGVKYSLTFERLMLVANLAIMVFASLAYITGSWFGPVSLSVPVVMVSKLLSNMGIMGLILRMDNFSREQQVGTYCITCAILALPDVGPSDQPELDALDLVQAPAAVAWTIACFVATGLCCLMMISLARRPKDTPPSVMVSLVTYVTAQVMSAVISTSASKMFPLLGGFTLLLAFAVAGVAAIVNVVSLILAATAVDQAIFIPSTTCFTLLTNMATGLLLWEDWRVIDRWMAYIMLHLIMTLGIVLLAPNDAIQQYSNHRRVSVIKEAAALATGRESMAVIVKRRETMATTRQTRARTASSAMHGKSTTSATRGTSAVSEGDVRERVDSFNIHTLGEPKRGRVEVRGPSQHLPIHAAEQPCQTRVSAAFSTEAEPAWVERLRAPTLWAVIAEGAEDTGAASRSTRTESV